MDTQNTLLDMVVRGESTFTTTALQSNLGFG